MFLSVKRIKGHEYVYLVANRREEGRVVQHILQYFGRMEPDDIGRMRDRLRLGLGAVGRGRHEGGDLPKS